MHPNTWTDPYLTKSQVHYKALPNEIQFNLQGPQLNMLPLNYPSTLQLKETLQIASQYNPDLTIHTIVTGRERERESQHM